MQNTVTELSHRLLRSLDSNYNVIDMPAVVEIISALEHTSITEDLLKTTRLGKYVNELRRKTSNETLARRAKELLKKWRDQVLPSAHQTPPAATAAPVVNGGRLGSLISDRSNSPDVNLNRIGGGGGVANHKKRPLSSLVLDDSSSNSNSRYKRLKMNGRHIIDESDNSNSNSGVVKKLPAPSSPAVVLINSDSNSCSSDRIPSAAQQLNDTNLTFSGRNLGGGGGGGEHLYQLTPIPTQQQPPPPPQVEPKRRGRKKGSKNHKTLLVQAEESFTNKMAVSVNAKVKTTEELLANIQNKSLNLVMPQKVTPPMTTTTTTTTTTAAVLQSNSPIIVDESENSRSSFYPDSVPSVVTRECSEIGSDLSKHDADDDDDDEDETVANVDCVNNVETVETILAKLPKVDFSCLLDGGGGGGGDDGDDQMPACTCPSVTSNSNNGDLGSIFDVPDTRRTIISDSGGGGDVVPVDCPAKRYLDKKYRLNESIDAYDVERLHTTFIDSINGNRCLSNRHGDCDDDAGEVNSNGLYTNIVPNFHNGEIINKNLTLESINYIKFKPIINYPVINSDDDDGDDDDTIVATDDDVNVIDRTNNCYNNNNNNNLICQQQASTSSSNSNQLQQQQQQPRLTHHNFREYHQCVSLPSYNNELLHILPYVVLD